MKEYIKRTIKKKRKDKYTYDYRDKDNNKVNSKVADKATDSIYIPPAYDDVKINLNQKEKVLAIGYDEKQRPQYVYNKKFTERNSKKKFHKMIEFGESYQKIMNSVRKYLYSEGDTKEKQIAMTLMLVVDCGIRIGSEKYKNENDSFGATTLESRHVKVHGDTVSVDFIGKKGVRNKCKMRSKRLSRNVRIKKRTLNKDDPIFTYRRGNCWYSLKSTDVNKYLKKFGKFRSKNFRTWVANLSFITEILKYENPKSETQKKKNVNEAVHKTARKLNNTATVCKTNYIDPYLVELYLNDTKRFLGTFKHASTKDEISENYIKLLKTK
jgi:DNA topoisomerase-1